MDFRVSIDIGIIRIKVLAIEYLRNEITNIEAYAFNYANSIVNNIADKSEINEDTFLENYDAIEEQIIKIKKKFPSEAKYFLSVNSFPGQLFYKKLNVKSKKRLKFAIKIFQNQTKEFGYTQDYSVIDFDKISQEAKVLLYSYSNDYLEKLLSMFKINDMELSKIELDVVNLLNTIDLHYQEGEFLFIDIGFSKTNFIHISDNELVDFGTSKIALNLVVNRLSREKNVPIIEVINNLMGTDFVSFSKKDYDVFFRPLITGINDELNSFQISEKCKIVISGGIANHFEFYSLLTKFFDNDVSKLKPLEKIFEFSSKRFDNSLLGNVAGLILR